MSSLLRGDDEFEIVDFDEIIDQDLNEIDQIINRIDQKENDIKNIEKEVALIENKKKTEYKKNMDYYIYYLAFNAVFYNNIFGKQLFDLFLKKGGMENRQPSQQTPTLQISNWSRYPEFPR